MARSVRVWVSGVRATGSEKQRKDRRDGVALARVGHAVTVA